MLPRPKRFVLIKLNHFLGIVETLGAELQTPPRLNVPQQLRCWGVRLTELLASGSHISDKTWWRIAFLVIAFPCPKIAPTERSNESNNYQDK